MKTLPIVTLLAAIFAANTASAQFGGFHQRPGGHRNHTQQGFRQNRAAGSRLNITPELIGAIIQQFDDRNPSRPPNTVVLTGTWEENYNGVLIRHTIYNNGYHELTYPATGRIHGHMATYDGLNIRLLNGLYTVTETAPGVLQLGKTGETRFWHRVGNGNGGGTVTPPIPPAVNSGIPQQLQGIWYAISPEGTRWIYVFRRNSYDMFDFDPATGQPIMEDGQPVQLLNSNLTHHNGVLNLSPGTEFEDGPFTTTASPDGTQLYLTPTDGGQPRLLTRQPQN